MPDGAHGPEVAAEERLNRAITSPFTALLLMRTMQ